MDAVVGPPLASTEQLFDREPDVAGNLAEERGRNIAPRVEWNGRPAAVGVPILAMRPTLPDLLKPVLDQERSHLARLQNRQRTHAYATRIVCRPMNSDSSFGSPSSRSIAMTSRKFCSSWVGLMLESLRW